MSNSEGSSMSSPSRQVTVVDVYDLAAAIGKDFELLIQQHGADQVKVLMPKVISALEMLETFAQRNERENEQIFGLKSVVTRLETEKQETIEGRAKFENELVHIEENYRAEIKELWDVVSKLQDENKRLQESAKQESAPTSPMQTSMTTSVEMCSVPVLREKLDEQRRELRSLNLELNQRHEDIDRITAQNDKLNRINRELMRKNRAVQGQGRLLVEEKAELISHIHARDQVISQLQNALGSAERAKRDLEQTKVEEQIANTSSSSSSGDHTPRFTLAELREVLHEKNTLKQRCMELEDELEALKGNAQRRSPAPQPDDDDLPVEGPMPREPDEKLYPWNTRRSNEPSGIRKLFGKLGTTLLNRRASMRQATPPTTDRAAVHFTVGQQPSSAVSVADTEAHDLTPTADDATVAFSASSPTTPPAVAAPVPSSPPPRPGSPSRTAMLTYWTPLPQAQDRLRTQPPTRPVAFNRTLSDDSGTDSSDGTVGTFVFRRELQGRRSSLGQVPLSGDEGFSSAATASTQPDGVLHYNY